MKNKIYVALGANLPHQTYGSPPDILNRAVNLLALNIKIISFSRLYRSQPVPISTQPDYANAVIEIETDKTPYELLQFFHRFEKEFGRARKVRNEARVLDLDIIDYNGLVLADEEIHLPHPRMHERLFVLLPLKDIAPDWRHPISHKTVGELIETAPKSAITLWE